jgi:hypothetical protein
MKALFLTLLLLCSNVFAFDSSSAYNVVAMSFPANQMIFNRVVLDATQKAQTSVTFTADVQNGGGRPTHNLDGTPRAFPTQTDSAFIRMRLHDAAGTLISTVTSPTYILRNLGSDPGNGFSTKPGDNLHPWTLATVTYTGDLSNVRFVQLEMVGTDGAFWAGNYGPMWRVPTVTFGANATNTVYNPEFGIAPNSVRAQGWFNSSNSWAMCGVTSGNVPCVTSVAGVNANMWGGGYDVNGGSLAGQAGGYNGSLTSSSADQAASTGSPAPPPPPAGPTVTGGTITQTNAPSNQTIISGSSPTGPSANQQTRINTWVNGSQLYNNIIYIDQTYGSNNTVTMTQDGYNNRIDFTLGGNGNTTTTTQTGSNYLKQEIPGWGNYIVINQTNTVGKNYAETKIQGNGNTVNHTQQGNANQMLFSTITGDINTVNTTQSGSGAHYAESKIIGNWNTVKIDQFGNTANKATVDITNAGGAANVDIQQSGGKSFGIIQSCTNPAGCSTVVRQ